MPPSDEYTLPEDPDQLYAIATTEEEDPYRREAAIKKLGRLESAGDAELRALTEEGLSAIEREVATSTLAASHSAPTTTTSPDPETDELRKKVRQEGQQFREMFRSELQDESSGEKE